MNNWSDWTRARLTALKNADRWRECLVFDKSIDSDNAMRGDVAGRSVISFASNDYLGLATHPQVRAAAHAAIDRWGTGSSASRLVTGTRSLHKELEAALAKYHHVESALLFPTGYSANLGVLTALGASDVTIFSDQLNHASIIDGCRLAKAQTLIYRHCELAHLESLLSSTTNRKLIITESIFSMDGDAAPLEQIAALACKYNALLVIDEAHAVLGPEVPVSAELQLVRIGTLSKTLGSLGGWVGASQGIIDYLVNSARSFIFTTASTPADTAAALAALDIYHGDEGEQLRARLRKLIDQIRPHHASPIIPIILGSDAAALQAARLLFEQGIYIPAIRPPTVPVGTSRLRLTLSALHDDAAIGQLQHALTVVGVRQ